MTANKREMTIKVSRVFVGDVNSRSAAVGETSMSPNAIGEHPTRKKPNNHIRSITFTLGNLGHQDNSEAHQSKELLIQVGWVLFFPLHHEPVIGLSPKARKLQQAGWFSQ
uniref:Uncharacterized protein n=1 Tax=Schistocephalus solidus TaxID=70667 RepID=A0A0X3P345_SCHSO